MSQIDKNTVKKVAHLARLELDDKELELYCGQLSAIVQYISKLSEIDTSNTIPTCHPLATLKNVFRKDVLKESIPAEDALGNAPSREADYFKVPQIIEFSGANRNMPLSKSLGESS